MTEDEKKQKAKLLKMKEPHIKNEKDLHEQVRTAR